MIGPWKRAHGPELSKLGALYLRRYVLLRELADVNRMIGESREVLIALERTATLAGEAKSEGEANGHTEGASGQGT